MKNFMTFKNEALIKHVDREDKKDAIANRDSIGRMNGLSSCSHMDSEDKTSYLIQVSGSNYDRMKCTVTDNLEHTGSVPL